MLNRKTIPAPGDSGHDITVVEIPEGYLTFRRIIGTDCETSATTSSKRRHGRWYGSLKTAFGYVQTLYYVDKNKTHSIKICIVKFKKKCLLLDVTAPNTQAYLVWLFQKKDKQDEQEHKSKSKSESKFKFKYNETNVRKAFGIQKEGKYKYRNSLVEADIEIVSHIFSVLGSIDGYIWVSQWSTQSEETFDNEIYLHRPEQCVRLLTEHQSNSFMSNISQDDTKYSVFF